VNALLARLGIARREARAWALYDWANSAYFTVVVTAVFPVYYREVVGAGLADGEAMSLYLRFLSVSALIAGLASPAIGAVADYLGARKRALALFTALGVLASAAMFFVDAGDWLLGGVLAALGNLGIVGAVVCYDSLLTHVAEPGEEDALSTTGYGLGYLGGGLLLGLNLAWILKPEWFGLPSGEGLTPAQATLPTRLAFLSVAAWWALFSIPLFLRVPEPPRRIEPDEAGGRVGAARVVATAFQRLRETFAELRGYREAFLLLVAALCYGEGIGTIIRLAGIYAKDLELDKSWIILAILVTQFVGIPFAVLFGRLAQRIGARAAIHVALAVYVGVCVFAAFLDSGREFLAMAVVIGMVQGGAQALTRSLYASLIPAHKSAEFFGLFVFASKVAGFGGPVLFDVVQSVTGSNRPAILSLSVLFVGGMLLLRRVDVARGRTAARAAEEELRAV
jgi:UMF1 family MFS transporter